MKLESNQGYQEEAPLLLVEYEHLSFDAAHQHVLPYFPTHPVSILDIGSGTGRDANHLANLGHDVTAVEPTDALREGAKRLHPNPNITWIDDGLPNLVKINDQPMKFDLILVSAVWMHLDQQERKRAMPIVAALMHESGTLIVNLRHGPVPQGRRMFEVSDEEMIDNAEGNGLSVIHRVHGDSILPRNQAGGVIWSHFVFKKDTLNNCS